MLIHLLAFLGFIGVIIGQGAVPTPPVTQGFYNTDFNTMVNGQQPSEWCDHGAEYGDPTLGPGVCDHPYSAINTSIFSGSPSYLTVYELTPVGGGINDDYHTSYIGTGSSSWSGYELRADVRMNGSKSQGLLIHSQMPADPKHYSFRIFYAQSKWRLTNETNAHPVDTCLDTDIYTSVANIWHHVKMKTTVVAGVSVTVDACIWRDGSAEPNYGDPKDQATSGCGSCIDTTDILESGTIGTWTHSVGGTGRYIDNIVVNNL